MQTKKTKQTKDKRALIILFPAGQELHFKPEQEISTPTLAK